MSRTSGFTLIELLLVLAIIGIISAIAVPALLGQRARARMQATRQNVVTIIPDLTTVLAELSDAPSQRRAGLPTTIYSEDAAGYEAKAEAAISWVMAQANYAQSPNPYSSTTRAYQSASTPALGSGVPGIVYLDPSTANSTASPVITVTGVYLNAKGSPEHLAKTVSLN